MDEYCKFILTQSPAHRKLALSCRDMKTKSQLIKDAARLMDSMKSIYGSEYNAGKFLWGTISKFSTKRILYGHCKADGEIEELYQSTLEKIKAAKSSDTSFLSCYEVVLNLCLIYSNMVECRGAQEKCIRAVWTEVNIIAVYYWIAELEDRAEKLLEKYGEKVEKMDETEADGSLFKMFQ